LAAVVLMTLSALGPRKVHRYTAEFKLKAVKLSELDGVQVQDVAEALDIHPFMLSRWRKEVREGRIKARTIVAPGARQQRDVTELARIKRQDTLLQEEHELLKKAIRFCSAQRQRSLRSSTRSRTGSV